MTDRHISLSRDGYARLRRAARERGVSMSKLVELLTLPEQLERVRVERKS